MTTDLQADLQKLHAIRERLNAAENANDADYVIGMMAEDAVLMVPDFPVQEGKEACACFVREIHDFFRQSANRHITYVSAEVRVIGDMAIDRGTFSFTFAWKDGRAEPNIENGKYLWLYARNGVGEWKASRLIVTLDQRPEET